MNLTGPSQAEIAREFGMTENAVKQAFHRLRQRYRQLLREEVAQTVATPAEIEDELRRHTTDNNYAFRIKAFNFNAQNVFTGWSIISGELTVDSTGNARRDRPGL